MTDEREGLTPIETQDFFEHVEEWIAYAVENGSAHAGGAESMRGAARRVQDHFRNVERELTSLESSLQEMQQQAGRNRQAIVALQREITEGRDDFAKCMAEATAKLRVAERSLALERAKSPALTRDEVILQLEQAAREDALERAAKACEERSLVYLQPVTCHEIRVAIAANNACAAVIRALPLNTEGKAEPSGPCAYRIGLSTCGYTKDRHHKADGSPMDHEFTADKS